MSEPTPEDVLRSKRILSYLQSIAMQAVALQQYVSSMGSNEQEMLSWMDADLDSTLAVIQKEGESE